MAELNSTNEQQQPPARTTYTTVTYTTVDKGLSITISETITITNNNLDKSPVSNTNYELLLVPTIENTRTVVVPTSNSNEKTLSLPSITTNVVQQSSSQHNLYRPLKPVSDTNFAYIDESSDDRTFSSGDGIIYMSLFVFVCLSSISLSNYFIILFLLSLFFLFRHINFRRYRNSRFYNIRINNIT
jgi:hypothetical protein